VAFVPDLLEGLNAETILAEYDKQTEEGIQKIKWRSAKERLQASRNQERERLELLLAQEPQQTDRAAFEQLATDISARTRAISGHANLWGGFTSMLFNFGALFGTWLIVVVAQAWGRRIAFTIFFAASFFMTIFVFMKMGAGTLMEPHTEILVMAPILGFCILSIFGGYSVYFPELFPTRLRSTAISFCYNIARFISAAGPIGLGMFAAFVFGSTDEPLRWAGAVMSITFIFGIIFAWMGPETKGQPLPEE
jgi:MFS family permease